MHRFGPPLAALLAYAALVAGFTWPLLPHAATHMPATYEQFHYDTLHTAWMLSHQSRRLATPWTMLDAGIYHPEPRSLFYSTLSLGLVPYFAPTYLATENPTLALNLAFLACVALTAWTIHLVVWRWTGAHLAGAIGAVTFLVTETTLWGFVSSAQYYAALQYQPLFVFAAAAPTSALAASPWLAVLIALQCVADPLYVAPAVMLPLTGIALWRIARPATRPAGLRLLRQLCVAGLLLVPIYAGYLDVVARNPGLQAQSVFARPGPRPAEVVPGEASPAAFWVRGHLIAWWYRYPIPMMALLVIGLGALGLLAQRGRGTDRVRAAWAHCALWTLVGLVLPVVGRAVPMLRGIPRVGLVGLIALALLTGLGAAELSRRLRARLGGAGSTGLALAFLGALLVLPSSQGRRTFGTYPIQPTPSLDSPIVAALRAGTGPVLELPATRPALDARALYRATAHHRPLVNGYSSYFPAAARGRMQQVKRLPDPLALGLLRIETGITTIVVHTHELDAPTRAAWERIWNQPAARADLRPLLADDGVLLFEVVGRGP